MHRRLGTEVAISSHRGLAGDASPPGRPTRRCVGKDGIHLARPARFFSPPRRASAAFPIRSASPVRTVHDARNDRRHSTAPGGSRILQNSATGPSTDPNPYSLNSATDATTIRLGTAFRRTNIMDRVTVSAIPNFRSHLICHPCAEAQGTICQAFFPYCVFQSHHNGKAVPKDR